jgi:hypothetical protein
MSGNHHQRFQALKVFKVHTSQRLNFNAYQKNTRKQHHQMLYTKSFVLVVFTTLASASRARMSFVPGVTPQEPYMGDAAVIEPEPPLDSWDPRKLYAEMMSTGEVNQELKQIGDDLINDTLTDEIKARIRDDTDWKNHKHLEVLCKDIEGCWEEARRKLGSVEGTPKVKKGDIFKDISKWMESTELSEEVFYGILGGIALCGGGCTACIMLNPRCQNFRRNYCWCRR